MPVMTSVWLIICEKLSWNESTVCSNFKTLFLSVHLFIVLQSPSKECEPYRTSEKKPIAPCGAIANSLFNGKANMCEFSDKLVA